MMQDGRAGHCKCGNRNGLSVAAEERGSIDGILQDQSDDAGSSVTAAKIHPLTPIPVWSHKGNNFI